MLFAQVTPVGSSIHCALHVISAWDSAGQETMAPKMQKAASGMGRAGAACLLGKVGCMKGSCSQTLQHCNSQPHSPLCARTEGLAQGWEDWSSIKKQTQILQRFKCAHQAVCSA